MKKLIGSVLLAALLVPAVALDGRSADTAPAAATAAPTEFILDVKDARAKSGRVPNGYGALGLTRDQKERIYGIQAAYSERVKALEAEIEQLKAEQGQQIELVLNDAQKAAIRKYNEQMSARRTR